MYIGIYSFLVLAGLGVKRALVPLVLGLSCLFLVLFMGTRLEVGCDFRGYFLRFVYFSPVSGFQDLVSRQEFGFEFLIQAVRYLELDYVWLNVFASALIAFGIFRFAGAFDKPLMILALLFPIIIIQLGMSGIRQGIAVAMLMASARPFINGSRLGVAFWILLASLFHASAIIFLPIALLAGRRANFMSLLVAALVAAPAMVLLGGDRVETYNNRYIAQIYGEVSSGGAFFRYGMVLVPALAFFWLERSFRTLAPRQVELLRTFSIIAIGIGSTAFISTLALHRLSYYVMPLSIVILVYASDILAVRDRSLGNAWRLVPAFIYGGYMISWFLLSRHADLCYTPYRSYLF